jgi:Tfp pilus assembly protein PilO
MRPSTYRLLSILGSLAFLIGAIIVYTNLVQPAYSDVQTLRGKKAALQDTIAQDKQAVATVNNLVGQYQNLSQLRDSISNILPTEERVPEAVYQLQGIASARQMEIQSLSFQYLPMQATQAGSLVKPLGTLSVNIRIAGTYQNFKLFLSDLETNIRLMDVSSVKIEGGSVPGVDKLTYTVAIDTYYQ